MSDQIPFILPELIVNPEPRCPCLLLLDTSASMAGAPMDQLNQGLKTLKQDLESDGIAMQRVEIAIITFGPVQLISDFQTASNFTPPNLTTSGDTPIGAAILQGLELLEQRKQMYRKAGISYFRPWVFLISDGSPTDDWKRAAQKVQAGDNIQQKQFCFFAVGVNGADMDTLGEICSPNRPPLQLKGLCFRELFAWLSNSLSNVSRSQLGDTVLLPPPTGWSAV